MPDIEFFDLWYDSDRPKIGDGQAVSRVHGELELSCELCCLAKRRDRRWICRFVRELARVKLDCFGADLPGHANGFLVRSDEQTRTDPGTAQRRNRPLYS